MRSHFFQAVGTSFLLNLIGAIFLTLIKFKIILVLFAPLAFYAMALFLLTLQIKRSFISSFKMTLTLFIGHVLILITAILALAFIPVFAKQYVSLAFVDSFASFIASATTSLLFGTVPALVGCFVLTHFYFSKSKTES
jgi:hypothetical protein